jgi:hypothetical protein
MPDIFRLKVVDAPEPGAASIVVDFDAPGTKAMEGHDAAAGDLYCGQCGALLVAGMPRRGVARTSVIRCKLCRVYNDPSSLTRV